VILFCGNKILRSTDSINAIQVSIGDAFKHPCFKIEFNDGSAVILPKHSKIHLIDKELELLIPGQQCYYNSKARYKVKFCEPNFTLSNKDPYLIGVALCSPLRNKKLSTKKTIFLNTNNMPSEYYSFLPKKMSGDYYQLSPEPGYPDLLRLEIKKNGNLSKLKQRQIPDKYLFAERSQREALLRGCMDIFGHYRKRETTFETCSYQLAKDIIFLTRSIGGFASIREKKSKSIFYIVSLSFADDFNPFLLKNTNFTKNKRPRVRSIASIEDAGELPCVEVPIDYAILDNFIKVS
jgi:hypothetical protein